MGGLLVIVGCGVALAWVAREHSFALMWGAAGQLILAVFLSVVLTRPIVVSVGGENAETFFYAATLLMLCLMFFLAMFVAMKQFMPNIIQIRFPVVVDRVVAMMLGFVTGALVASLLLVSIGLTPLASLPIGIQLAGGENLAQTTGGPVRLACILVGHLSFQSEPLIGNQALQALLDLSQQPPPK